LEEYPDNFGFSVSHTTRSPRPGESDGVQYHFTTKDQMLKEIEDNKFVEYANVHGNLYGTSKKAVEHVISQGKICILDIDVQGCEKVKKSSLKARYTFIAPPSMEELEKRLRGRATETEETIQKRIFNAKGEMEYMKREGFFDRIFENSDLETTYKEFKTWVFQEQ